MSLKAVSLSDQIARHLAEEIITGTLAPGARLPESELAKQLDVSTNSLREAFRVLEKQHLIELQPRKGARVCDITDEQVRDLYDFLFMLLSRLASQAASHWLPGQVEDLIKMLDGLSNGYRHRRHPDSRQAAKVAQVLYEESAESRAERERLRALRVAERAGYRPPETKPDKRARRLIRALGDIDAL